MKNYSPSSLSPAALAAGLDTLARIDAMSLDECAAKIRNPSTVDLLRLFDELPIGKCLAEYPPYVRLALISAFDADGFSEALHRLAQLDHFLREFLEPVIRVR